MDFPECECFISNELALLLMFFHGLYLLPLKSMEKFPLLH